MPRKRSATGLRLRTLARATIIVVLLALAASAVYLVVIDGSESEAPVVTSLVVDYPAGWRSEDLSQDEEAVGLLLSATHSSPEASILAREVPGRPAEPFDVEALGAEIENALATEVSGFELVSRGTAEWGDFEAVQIYYRQEDEGAQYQAMMVVVPTERQTFYLTLRSAAIDFPEVETGAREIMNSIVADLADAGLRSPNR